MRRIIFSRVHEKGAQISKELSGPDQGREIVGKSMWWREATKATKKFHD